jgi:hypothetical protein
MMIIYIVHENFIIENSHHQYWKMRTLRLNHKSTSNPHYKKHSRLQAEKNMTAKRSYVVCGGKDDSLMKHLHEVLELWLSASQDLAEELSIL